MLNEENYKNEYEMDVDGLDNLFNTNEEVEGYRGMAFNSSLSAIYRKIEEKKQKVEESESGVVDEEAAIERIKRRRLLNQLSTHEYTIFLCNETIHLLLEEMEMSNIPESIIEMQTILAINAISKYLNKNVLIMEGNPFHAQITSLSISYIKNFYYHSNNNNRQITQFTEGSRSITYSSTKEEFDKWGLTAEVRATLPAPRMRVFY